jgi:glycosyltransferase involved in cell wall biosynthesis
MHIAHFTNTYLPRISGVVRSVSAFRKALTELGHNVFVFAQEEPGYQDEEPFIFRYPTINLPFQVEFPAIIPVSPFIDTLLPSLKLDVIHTHHPILLGQTAVSKARELDLPLVFTFHTQYREYTHYFPIPQENVQEFLKDTVVNWLGEFMQKCQHIVVPTHSMREILTQQYGLEERLTVIPTGIDLHPFEQADGEEVRRQRGWEDDKVLISIGRMALEKNWRTLLEAGAKAMQNCPNLRVVLVGDGPELKELKLYVRQLGIANRVDFTGKVPFSQIPALLKAADLFGFASITETQGLVTLEAMAAGLPVAAVKATGTSDVLEDGKQGILTENNSAALAQAIADIASDDMQIQNFKKAALEKARSYDIMLQTEKLVNVYQQAIEDKKAGYSVKISRHGKLFDLSDLNQGFEPGF